MTEQSNIEDHSEKRFQAVVEHGLKHGGIHVVASKSHGKSRLLFSMAKQLRNLENCRVIVFDGSETWLYAFDKIETFTINERDIVLMEDVKTTEEIERYALTNWHLVELALETYPNLLFRLKTRKPSKRGFFVRTVIDYLDAQQRKQRETTEDNEAKGYIAYFIEEAQDCFNSRSTTRLEAEEFLTVFNEARNQKEAFFTASQRLTDFSKTIRTKQAYCVGSIPEEDKVLGIRRLEKQHSIDFAKIPSQTWFFNGDTFKSPTWKQNGKPFQVNRDVKKRFIDSLPQPQKTYSGILGKVRKAIDGFKAKVNTDTRQIDPTEEPTTNTNDYVAEEEEESELPFEFLEDGEDDT
jgi:hypothetical protein